VAFRWQRSKTHEKDKSTGIMTAKTRYTKLAQSDVTRIAFPESTWPPIIDAETWAAVQTRMGAERLNKQAASRHLQHKEAFLLRGGFVRCGCCGSRMQGDKQANRPYIYRCPKGPARVSHPEDACPGGSQTIGVATLDAAAWAAAKIFVSHSEDIRAILYARMTAKDEDSHLGRQLDALDNMMAEKKAQRERLTKGVVLTDDEDMVGLLMKEAEGLSKDIRLMEKQRVELAEKFLSVELWNAKLQKTIARVQALEWENLDSLSYEDRRNVLQLLGMTVDVYPTDSEFAKANKWGQRWDIQIDVSVIDEGARGPIVTPTSRRWTRRPAI
jgi:site-specific DNA recombinase